MARREALNGLLTEVRGCAACATELPLGPRPVLQLGRKARLVIAGQAPGVRVHETGVPFNDPSGDRLRDWLGIDRATFYDAQRVALLPMAFCYPGTGKSGDVPPPPRCARLWRERLLAQLDDARLTLVIGQYAIAWHLGKERKRTLTATVAAWADYGEAIMPLPHPSPRNNIWLKRNPWFEAEVLPTLRRRVSRALAD